MYARVVYRTFNLYVSLCVSGSWSTVQLASGHTPTASVSDHLAQTATVWPQSVPVGPRSTKEINSSAFLKTPTTPFFKSNNKEQSVLDSVRVHGKS